MEAQRLMGDDPLVQNEAAQLQPLFRPGVAGIENWHIVLFRHGVDGVEKRQEVFLRIDVFLPVGGEQNVLAPLKTQPGMNVRGLNLGKVPVEHLGHGRAGNVGSLLGQSRIRQIPAGMLGIGHVHIGNDVHDPPVGFLRQALILAAVARLHVKNGDVQPLGADDGQAGIGIAQHQHRVGLNVRHQLVGLGNDVAHGFPQVGSHGVQVHLRIGKLQVVEKHAVQVIVVVLPCVGQNHIKIAPGFVDHRRQPDDLRPGADDDQKLQLSVILKGNASIIRHNFSFIPVQRRYPVFPDRSTRWPT